jgi:hypothetical protein
MGGTHTGCYAGKAPPLDKVMFDPGVEEARQIIISTQHPFRGTEEVDVK